MSMNPGCDNCGGEDSEHCLCAQCMTESAEIDRAVGFNEGWATAVKTIEAWLREVAADPRLAHAGGVDAITDAADALQIAERWQKAPPKRSDDQGR
ncbi:MAG: hypothetical protein KF850_33110 [Labilithrix sp.]|nr:hypothetical protein [Labilithrix sp.]MBX3216919.1 hypothetical protein [Labilithrix sp.]